jgi:hypothetical protein
VLPLGHVLAGATIRRHVATLSHRIENTDADAIPVEQRLHINLSAGRCDIPQRSSMRAVGIDGGYMRLAAHRGRPDAGSKSLSVNHCEMTVGE